MDRVEDAELRMLLAQRVREWNKRLADLKHRLDQKGVEIEQQRERGEMSAYVARRKAELRDEIAPELLDYVRGTTVEEVEASIVRAQAKTASILEGVRQVQVPSAPAQPRIPPQQPQPQGGAQQPTLEQLRAVEVGSPEHMALRRQYGMTRGRGQGIFG